MDQAGPIPCLEGTSIAMLLQLDLSRGAIKLDWEDQNQILMVATPKETTTLEYNQILLLMVGNAYRLQQDEESHLFPETVQTPSILRPERKGTQLEIYILRTLWRAVVKQMTSQTC